MNTHVNPKLPEAISLEDKYTHDAGTALTPAISP